MASVTPNTQFSADEARQWQIKWGTPVPVQVEYAQVRAYGHLGVSITNPQQLAVCLNVQDVQELEKTARVRLKEMAVQALKNALAEQGLLAFPAHAGSLAPERVEQVAACVSTALRAQLAEIGLALDSFVIAGNSYQHQPEHSELTTGGDNCSGCRAIRMQLGFGTLSEASPQSLGLASEAGIKMGMLMQAMLRPTGAPPPPAGPYPDWMTPTQVAAYLQITEAEVCQLIESGRLKGEKNGAEYHISRAQLEEYLRA